MPTQPKPESKEISIDLAQVPRTRDPHFALTYANNASVFGSNTDLRITFGEIVNLTGRPEDFELNEKVSVVMTWEHAKALAQVIADHVRAHEKKGQQG